MIGIRIREERKKKKLTLQELGDQIGVSKSYLSKIENGSETPNIKLLTKISEVLELPLHYLFKESFQADQEMKDMGIEWVMLGEELEGKGITIDDVKSILNFYHFSKNYKK